MLFEESSLISATSRRVQVRRYRTLGNTLIDASGVHRPGTNGKVLTAADINCAASAVRA